MRLMERDIEILKTIYLFGSLTTAQIAKLYGFNLKVCQKKLRLLCKADYLRSVPIPTIKAGRAPNLFYLGEQSEKLLNVRSLRPRLNRQMSHLLSNINIMIKLALDFKKLNIECTLLPEHYIRRTKEERELFPDGAFMLGKNGKKALFFMENCSGTEIVKSKTLHQDIETKLIT